MGAQYQFFSATTQEINDLVLICSPDMIPRHATRPSTCTLRSECRWRRKEKVAEEGNLGSGTLLLADIRSLLIEGEGGATLGERGHSKDCRPHLNQMIVGVIIIDQKGRPVCSEMWPGNTADVTTLMPVIDRLRNRFAIERVCVVADRGMISAATIAALEQRGLEYILGVRERSIKEVREVVMGRLQEIEAEQKAALNPGR
jgi:Transposase DDE domain